MGTWHIAVVATLVLAGCPRDAGEPATTGPTTGPTAGPTTGQSPDERPKPPPPTTDAPAPPDAAGWVGTWMSLPCGERKYTRVIELAKGGVARGQDLVSPCPPNVACVWSGIVSFEGTWKLAGDRVTLELGPTGHESMKLPALPTELTWSGAPVGVESGVPCHYRAR